MKRKVVVIMSAAYWTDDKNYNDKPSNEDLITEAEGLVDDGTIIEVCEELVVIKIEITETKP